MLARLLAYARGLARRHTISAEVDEELQFHLEREVEAHIARGVPATEARRMALRDLGGLTQTREAVSDIRRIWIDDVRQDVRYAIRDSTSFARIRCRCSPDTHARNRRQYGHIQHRERCAAATIAVRGSGLPRAARAHTHDSES